MTGEDHLEAARFYDVPEIIAFDVTDLLEFINQIGHVTGIQRVQTHLLKRTLLSVTNFAEHASAGDVQLVCLHGPWGFATRSVSKELFRQLFALLDDASIHPARTKALIKDLYNSAEPITLQKHDWFILLGAFWNYPVYPFEVSRLASLQIRIILLCYDLIPLEAPEYCVATLVANFCSSVNTIFPFVDEFICISNYTAASVRRAIAKGERTDQRVSIMPLAHSIGEQSTPRALTDRALSKIRKTRLFPKRPYALFVGTIEARKNLGYLIDIWKELRSIYGDAMPDLVLAGRPGWNVDNLLNTIAARNTRGRYIYQVHGLSDMEITALYRGCEFSIFPSLLEGWGLPVGEALSENKLTFASNASSIPEVGSDYAIYIDPLNAREAINVIGSYISDPAKIEAVSNGLLQRFQPRTWDEVFDDFARNLRDFSRSAANNRNLTTVRGGFHEIGVDAAQFPKRSALVLKDGWHLVEPWGTWSSHLSPTIKFAITQPCKNVDLDFNLLGPPWINGEQFEVWTPGDDGELLRTATLTREPRWFRVTAPVIDGVVSVEIRLHNTFPMNDPNVDTRSLGVGISAYCCIPEGDTMAQLRALEARTLGPQLFASNA